VKGNWLLSLWKNLSMNTTRYPMIWLIY